MGHKDLYSPVCAGEVVKVKQAKWLPPLWMKLSAIANTGSARRAVLTVLKTRYEIQVEDPIIIYRVAPSLLGAPSRLAAREVLPLGTAASKKGR